MINLAGQSTRHADAYIEDELKEACIPIFQGAISPGEVPASLIGEHGRFRFERAWYYWVVNGPVPLDVAQAMYEDPRGRNDVRVDGNCGCPEPKDRVMLYHIDSQDGLNLFAEKVLGTRPLPPTQEEKEAALDIARGDSGARVRTVVYEDSPTEEDYLEAAREVHDIRNGLSKLRGRLYDLSRGLDKGLVSTDSVAHTVACSLTTALVTLYQLEDSSDDRSFQARAQRTKERWEDIYRNPTAYTLQKEGGKR